MEVEANRLGHVRIGNIDWITLPRWFFRDTWVRLDQIRAVTRENVSMISEPSRYVTHIHCGQRFDYDTSASAEEVLAFLGGLELKQP